MIPEIFTNLRAGVVYGAVRRPASTVRNWVTVQKLNIGTAKDGGYPRYDFVDVAKLYIMDRLISWSGTSAEAAADIVRYITPELVSEIEAYFAECKDDRKWQWSVFPLLVINGTFGDRSGKMTDSKKMVYREAGDVFAEKMGNPHLLNFGIPIPLYSTFSIVRMQLISVIEGDIPEMEDRAG